MRKSCKSQVIWKIKKFLKSNVRTGIVLGGLLLAVFLLNSGSLFAQQKVIANQNGLDLPFFNFHDKNSTGGGVALSLQILLLVTILSLAPSILVLMTSFLRISIVLDFVRRALSLQTTPPNAIVMGLAFFLTIFLMWPTFTKIYEVAYKPLSESEINLEQFYERSLEPLRLFMYRQMENTRHKEIRFFMRMAGLQAPENFSQVPTYTLIPAYIIHELTVAFKMGVLVMLPFIVIDLIVSTILMSMGMIMLPPVVISLPFKLLVFVLVDGWSLISSGVLQSFRI